MACSWVKSRVCVCNGLFAGSGKCTVKQVAFHHYRGRYVPYILELAQKVAPLPLTMLNDGMEINL